MPGLVQLRNEFPGKVEIIGMHVGKGTDADVESVVKAQNLPYPVVRGDALPEFKSYGLKSLPSIVVVDEAGLVRFVGKAKDAETFAHAMLSAAAGPDAKAPSKH